MAQHPKNTMIDYAALLHYLTIAGIVGINSLAVGWAQGLVGYEAMFALDIQPHAQNSIKNIMLFGTALIEASAVFALIFAIFMLSSDTQIIDKPYACMAELGILCALSLAGPAAALAAARPARASCKSIAAQPLQYPKIIRLMFLNQSIIQTAVIFALVLCFAILDQSRTSNSIEQAMRLIAAGLAIGLGSLGPTIGLGTFAEMVCTSIGKRPRSFDAIFSFTLLSNAVIEAPTIFAFVIAIILLTVDPGSSTVKAMAFLGSALAIGFGTLGPGIGSGAVAAAACNQIAERPEMYPRLSKISLLCQGLIDTCAIYALLIALLLILS